MKSILILSLLALTWSATATVHISNTKDVNEAQLPVDKWKSGGNGSSKPEDSPQIPLTTTRLSSRLSTMLVQAGLGQNVTTPSTPATTRSVQAISVQNVTTPRTARLVRAVTTRPTPTTTRPTVATTRPTPATTRLVPFIFGPTVTTRPTIPPTTTRAQSSTRPTAKPEPQTLMQAIGPLLLEAVHSGVTFSLKKSSPTLAITVNPILDMIFRTVSSNIFK